MRLNLALLALITLTFLSACQKSGQDPATPVAASGNTLQGPSDGGGGDTCNGKMIESYKVDITTLPEYKDLIQPILDKITAQDKAGGTSASPFAFTPKIKNWYIVDCKLQDIPKERKGLYLETYQTAIHTSHEVFIDATSYNGMAKEEKAKLLLHEMVMGFYLMKYLTIEDMCKISGSCPGDTTAASSWKMFRPEVYRPLNDEDHQKIRNVTAWLWSQKDALTAQNFAVMAKNNDFDKRFESSGAASESTELEIDPQVLVRMLKKHQWSDSFPKFCQFNGSVSQSTCKTTVVADIRDAAYGPIASIKTLYLKLTIQRQSDQRELNEEFSYPLTAKNKKIKLYISKFGSILKAAPLAIPANWPNMSGLKTEEGLKSQMLFLLMNATDPANPEIFEIIYQTYIWYSFEDEIVERDGHKYKETYGYCNPVADSTEFLFMENELPFVFRPTMTAKTFIRSSLVMP